MSSLCPGLEVFYSAVQCQVKSLHDALICFLHWSFVHNGFKCIGVGEDSQRKKTEILPSGWNSTDDSYVLRYEPADSELVHVLKALRIDDTLLIHILRIHDSKVVDVSLRTAEFIDKEHLDDYNRCFKNLEELKRLVFEQLFKSLQTKDRNAPSSQSSERVIDGQQRRETCEDPLRVPTRHAPHRSDSDWGGRVDPFSVGRGDLDPFSGAAPGMLMDPMRGGIGGPSIDPYGGLGMPGRLPRGSIPPGARFDPIGPPRPDGGVNPLHPYSGEPNPDHMRPPGYDDMFM